MKCDSPSDHDDESAEGNGRRGIQSVGNAARILEALAGLGEASPLRTVSQRAGLSTSQAHRYLASLIAAGMAQQTPGSGLYDLGPVAIKLGLAALARTDVVQVAETAIAEFVKQTGRTVLVCALGPLGPTIVRWFAGSPPVVTSLRLGSVLSLTHSASGQVFLAYSPTEELAPILERERASLAAHAPDPEPIVQAVRARGYAAVSDTVAPGLRAVSFPIFDLQGQPTLSATAIASDIIDRAGDERTRIALGEVCAEISRSLGARIAVPETGR
jgi:DNA-binding IclR family transcriptional regulator